MTSSVCIRLKQHSHCAQRCAALRGAAQRGAAPGSAALIDCIVINGSIHTESRAAQRCAALRIKFETRAIRAAKCRAALRGIAQHCAHYASHVFHEY